MGFRVEETVRMYGEVGGRLGDHVAERDHHEVPQLPAQHRAHVPDTGDSGCYYDRCSKKRGL